MAGAVTRHITADDKFFLGTAQRIVGTVYQADGTTVENIATYTELVFLLAKTLKGTPANALLTKKLSLGEIALLNDGADGKYVITFDPEDTDGSADSLKPSNDPDIPDPPTYYYSVKRFDPEEILTEGRFAFLASTQRRE